MNRYPCFLDNYYVFLYGDCLTATNAWSGVEYTFNKTESLILKELTGNKTTAQIVASLAEQFNLDVEVLKDLVFKVILNNKKNGILEIREIPSSPKKMYGEFGKYYPKFINIELTNRCNFQCTHCYKEATKCGKDLPYEAIEYICKEFKGKVPDIQLSGGEPFLNRNIEKYIDDLSSNFNLSVVTNGSLIKYISPQTLSKINEIQISLYGTTEFEYENFTKNRTGYRNLVEGAQHLKNNDIQFCVAFTLNKSSIYKIQNFVEFAIQLGAKQIRFGIPSIVGRAIASSDNFVFNKEELQSVHRQIRRAQKMYRDKILIELWREHESFETSTEHCSERLTCGAGSKNIVVSENGNVRPCEFLPETYFNMGSICDFEKYIVNNKFETMDKNAFEYYKYLKERCVDAAYICAPLKRYLNFFANYEERSNGMQNDIKKNHI